MISQPNPLDARAYSAATMAGTGILLWGLQTYVLKNQPIPAAISADIYVLLPAAAGFVASHLTRKHTTAPTPVISPVGVPGIKIIPTQMASTTQTAPATPLPVQDSSTQEGASGPPVPAAPDTPSP